MKKPTHYTIHQADLPQGDSAIISCLAICLIFACAAAFLLGVEDGMDKADQQHRLAAYCATVGHSESLCGIETK